MITAKLKTRFIFFNNKKGNLTCYFLFTSEVNDTKFTDTLVETNHITTVRLIKRTDDLFILAIEDVNDNGFCAAFKTEESLRKTTKELLAAMNSNASIS